MGEKKGAFQPATENWQPIWHQLYQIITPAPQLFLDLTKIKTSH